MNSKVCPCCKEDKDLSMFCKDKQHKTGLAVYCRGCKSVKGKKYYSNNKEHVNAKNNKWHTDNLEYHRRINRENSRQYRIDNPEAAHNYYLNSGINYNAKSAKRRATKLKAMPSWYEDEKVKKVYKKAKEWKMEVDHIIPLINDIVCGLHCFDNLQLLSTTLNRSKGNRLVGGDYYYQ